MSLWGYLTNNKNKCYIKQEISKHQTVFLFSYYLILPLIKQLYAYEFYWA